ncbi:hypothetical protein I6I99_21105 [Sphingobacterium multivorum]|nr:hypothetical protein [Sphingobacterium multivorum]QQT29815.1 hypothetical protein I6I99_21105 [Sphingobacterium multivorum]
MKRILLTFSLGGLLISCSNHSPQKLAKDVCDCYQKLENIANETGKLEQLARCQSLQRMNMSIIEREGVDNNLTDEQLKKSHEEFDKIIENCSK